MARTPNCCSTRRVAVRPDPGGASERIQAFVGRELVHLPLHSRALPLVAYLLYGRGKRIMQTRTQLRELERGRASPVQA